MSTERGKTKKKTVTTFHGLSTRILTPDYCHCMSTEKLEEEKRKKRLQQFMAFTALVQESEHLTAIIVGPQNREGYSSSWPYISTRI